MALIHSRSPSACLCAPHHQLSGPLSLFIPVIFPVPFHSPESPTPRQRFPHVGPIALLHLLAPFHFGGLGIQMQIYTYFFLSPGNIHWHV